MRWCRGKSFWKRRPASATCRGGLSRPISVTSRRAHDKQTVNTAAQIEYLRKQYFPIYPLAFSSLRDGGMRAEERIRRQAGYGDVVEIADTATVRRASVKDAAEKQMPANAVSPRDALTPLAGIAVNEWRELT